MKCWLNSNPPSNSVNFDILWVNSQVLTFCWPKHHLLTRVTLLPWKMKIFIEILFKINFYTNSYKKNLSVEFRFFFSNPKVHFIKKKYEPNIKSSRYGEQEERVLARIIAKIKEFILYYGFTKVILQRRENQEIVGVLARECGWNRTT